MTEVSWTVRADRRVLAVEAVQAELEDLALGVEGLSVDVVDSASLRDLPDTGGFRDFVVVACMRAGDKRILDRVGEELIAEFGFAVDWFEKT